MGKEKLLIVRELKEDLFYLESNEQHVISTINMFQMFLEDRYRNEKSLAGGKIEIYEVLLKELCNLLEHVKNSKMIYEEKLKRLINIKLYLKCIPTNSNLHKIFFKVNIINGNLSISYLFDLVIYHSTLKTCFYSLNLLKFN